MPENKCQYIKRTWATGDVITAQRINNIENEMQVVSDEVTNAINGTIYTNVNNDILSRKLDGLIKYFSSTPSAGDLDYTRMYVQPTEEDSPIIVPTEQEYLNFKANFVSPFNKSNNYAAGAYVEYNDQIYKILTAISANASAADDAAAWNAITAVSDKVRKIDVMNQLDNLINVYSGTIPSPNEQNRIWIQQQSNSVEVPSMEEFEELSGEVDDLKSTFDNMEKAAMYDYSITGLINTSGVLQPSYTQYRATDFIACDKNSTIAIYDIRTGSSALAYAFYTEDKTFISGQSNIFQPVTFVQSIPTGAAYVRCSSRIDDGYGDTHNPKVVVYNFKGIKETVDKVPPLIQTFIYPYTTGKFINTNGEEAINSDYALTDFIICDNAAYVQFKDIYVGSAALAYAFYDKDKSFISGQNSISGDIVIQTIPSNARYLRSSCRVNDGSTVIHSPIITVYNNRTINKDIQELIDDVQELKNAGSNLKDLQILVFGDSISDTQNFTINSSNETTAYSEKTPNNSYIKNGQTINYYMWPSLIQRVLDVKELRNYAKSGAHFYTTSSTPADPRQKLLYQVQVALNDLDNPNDVFPYDDFNPDIVIVACGINDGNIAEGSFETTMAKTVMNQSETGVDVEATMAAMNQSNTMDAMRYVLMLLKQTFPEALFLYVNPLQQTYSTNDARLTARKELGKMAEQYDFINLDGFAQFGVVRDFETQGQVGLLTKDGLHPNEKGQNLYARNIVQAIKRYYFPLDQFNQ